MEETMVHMVPVATGNGWEHEVDLDDRTLLFLEMLLDTGGWYVHDVTTFEMMGDTRALVFVLKKDPESSKKSNVCKIGRDLDPEELMEEIREEIKRQQERDSYMLKKIVPLNANSFTTSTFLVFEKS